MVYYADCITACMYHQEINACFNVTEDVLFELNFVLFSFRDEAPLFVRRSHGRVSSRGISSRTTRMFM